MSLYKNRYNYNNFYDYVNNFKLIEPRTNNMYTNVWRTKPRVVGQPFVSAILPKSPPNTFWVNIYVYGCITKIKINAEKIVICHFL